MFIKDKEKLSIRKIAEKFCLSLDTAFKCNKGIIAKSKRICKAKIRYGRIEKDINKYYYLCQYEKAKKLK